MEDFCVHRSDGRQSSETTPARRRSPSPQRGGLGITQDIVVAVHYGLKFDRSRSFPVVVLLLTLISFIVNKRDDLIDRFEIIMSECRSSLLLVKRNELKSALVSSNRFQCVFDSL